MEGKKKLLFDIKISRNCYEPNKRRHCGTINAHCTGRNKHTDEMTMKQRASSNATINLNKFALLLSVNRSYKLQIIVNGKKKQYINNQRRKTRTPQQIHTFRQLIDG